MSSRISESKNALKEYMNLLWIAPSDKNLEYEIRFGTIGHRRITKINFNNVIKQLKSIGFVFANPSYTLKMQSEYIDSRTGLHRFSNIRTEIIDVDSIQQFCKTNNLTDETDRIKKNIMFNQKTGYRVALNDEGRLVNLRPGNYPDFNFRVSLQEEKQLKFTHGLVKQLLNDWADKKKLYRVVTRLRGRSAKYPGVIVDMSIVRGSKRNDRNRMIPTFNIKDSNVFNEPEGYEIELEYDIATQRFSSNENIALMHIKSTITNILRGLQQTNFPISYTRIDKVINKYMKLIHKSYDATKRIYPKNFIGPQPVSIELKNIIPLEDDSIVPNIRKPYTVTDKADGDRKLLFIDNTGNIYLIDTNMNVQFTGSKTESIGHFNSLLDGEHILLSKSGKYINVYAAFDIYFISNEDHRSKGFIPESSESDTNNYRYPLLQKFIRNLKVENISGASPLQIRSKTFYYSNGKSTNSIFHWCKQILDKEKDEVFEYEIDGLIFTPAHTGVGIDNVGGAVYDYKRTWNAAFKWKPAKYNTVDFLVSTKKAIDGTDFIGTIYEDGLDMSSADQTNQFKTLILRVGFDEKSHGYINPCNDVYTNNFTYNKEEDKNRYKPLQFYPTNPTNYEAGICNIMIKKDMVSGTNTIFTENGVESFEDNMIVEFRYDISKEKYWQWIPIRVRFDKTEEFRKGMTQYGNAYHVANSIWHSIHNPITSNMISTGDGIPDNIENDQVYYNSIGKTNTQALRNFHNLYVKRKLISSVSKRGGTLIDLAVGKGGDFPKWIESKLKFVFGVDISPDNIANRLDGACARYLNYRKSFRTMPSALFVVANSGLPLRNGDACNTDKGRDIVNAVFGVGPKDKKKLGEGVYRQYGVGTDGFDVVSCQFAIHYMFQNPTMLNNFLRNVNETCALNGYFIGTCYDGKSVFNLLEDKKQGESQLSYVNKRKIWEIRKMYDSDEFNNNSSSIGYAIDVFQESINKTFREYLVNFEYLTELLQKYGFELITTSEAKEMNLPNATGKFDELFTYMKQELKRTKSFKYKKKLNVKKALELEDSVEQREISFLNRYFVFKKITNVDAKEMASILDGKSAFETKVDEADTKEANKILLKEQEKSRKKKPKKLTKKLQLRFK